MENREAIEYINWMRDKFITNKPLEAIDLAISALKKQEQERWILVTKKLPEDYSDVLVWFEYFRYGNYNRLYQTYGIGNYSAQYDAWTVNYETGWNKLRVIAWRPLPEAFEVEEES